MPDAVPPAHVAPDDDPLVALLPQAKKRWDRSDPVMAQLARDHPIPPRYYGQSTGFGTLVESITHQQVSLGAGRSIHGRLVDAVGGAVTPESVLKTGPERLRAAGLSGSKVRYVLDLAERAADGRLDLERLGGAPDEEVIGALTAVKGIGVWTAKMYLIFHLHRPDVLVPEDLGVRAAASAAYNVPPDRAARLVEEKGRAWSPYASVAARVLWSAKPALGGR